MKRKSMYSKLLLFGFTLCVLPVLALGAFSYMKSAESVRSQMDQANIDLLKQLTGNIEQALKATDTNLNQVVNSAAMQEALYEPITIRQFPLYNSFRKNLSNLQALDSPVSDVVLLNFSNNWLINNERLYEFEQFPKKQELLRFNELPYDSTWSLKQTALLGSPSTELSGCANTIVLSKKLPVRSSEKRGLALAYIPSCRLADWIELQSSSQELMIVDPDNRIVFHRDLSEIGKSVLDSGYWDNETAGKIGSHAGQLEIEAHSKRYTLTYNRSELNGWLYLLMTDIQVVTRQSREIGWVTFYVSLAIILVSLCFVWLYSRNIYTPIRGIMQDISERQPGLPQRMQDEFQVINDHIRQLFVSNTFMKKEITQNTPQLRAFFLTKLFQGQLKKSELSDKMRLYGYEERLRVWDRLVVLTMQVDMLEQSRYSSGDLDLLLFAANNIVEESIPCANRLMPAILDQTQVTLIGASGLTDAEMYQYAYTLTETIRGNIQKFLQLNVSIGISLPFQHVQQAARAYREGMEALKHRLKLGEGSTIHFADVNAGDYSFIYLYPRQQQNELIDAIKLGDEEKALDGLNQWMTEVFSEDRSPSDYQISLVRLLNDLMIVMQESGIALQQIEAEGSSLYDELLQLYVPVEIERWLARKVIVPLAQVFRERGDSQYRSLSEAMIDLIQHRYDTDFTLEECASLLHYSTHYLSGVFKKETNLSFSDYLTLYRFHMAKKWLIEGDMAIKDIAQRLNYNNSQNFIRSFRKQEGMTPGQYREKYGGGKNSSYPAKKA